MPRPRRLFRIFSAAAVITLALTGCSTEATFEPSPDTSAQNSDVPVVPVDAATAAPSTSASLSGQEWADQKIHTWLEVERVRSIAGLYEPFRLIESWESPEPGHLVLYVDSTITVGDEVYHQNLGPANNLWLIPAVMLEMTWEQNRDLEIITARTTDGSREESHSREKQMGPVASGDNVPGTQDWADELVQLWLEAEGVRSVKGLLHTFSLIESWSATADDQITFVVHPSITEGDEIYLQHLGPANDLWMIPGLMMQNLYCRVPELNSIVATTSDGTRSEIITRADHRDQAHCWT